jgi:hypothetical protein
MATQELENAALDISETEPARMTGATGQVIVVDGGGVLV